MNSSICILHNNEWLIRQRVAGNIAAKTLSLLNKLVKEKTIKSLLELDKIAEEFIIKNNCIATFKNYKGFPNAVCISIDNKNKHALVHGIPTDYKLENGDLISFDLGCTFEGAIADTALTTIFGCPKSEEHSKLINNTYMALIKSIKNIKIGNKIGIIGNTIYKSLSPNNYGIVQNYGGHSLSYNEPHAAPFISNKSELNEGIRIQAGMTLAIEPLAVINKNIETYIGDDSWTVYTNDTSCHFEHTIYIHDDKIEVITLRENEKI